MIRAAGGPSFSFGFNTDTYQAQWATRATPVGSLAETERGDIVQWGGGVGGTLDPHTAIITTGGPNPQVIDSNYAARHAVGRGSLASRTPAGAIYRIWRVGKVGAREGAFVNASDTGRVYRIAGGAPLYVNSWAPFGGPQPTTARTQAQIDAMRRVPADGTFLHGQDSGHVFRVAGGAPLYVNSWAPYGGPQPTIGIPQWSIDNGALGHLDATPADGTLIHGQDTGRVYRVAGGAPIYIDAWGPLGGPQPSTGIPQWTIDTNALRRLRTYPADGTWISAGDTGRVYRVAGGAPLYITTFAPFGGSQPSARLTQATIDGGGLGHLRTFPADSTLLRALETGTVYRVAGGAALPISHWSHIGGPQPYVDVNQGTIDGRFGHLRAMPADGTVLRTMPSARVWQIAGGTRAEVPATTAGAVQVSDASVAGIPLQAQAVPSGTAPSGGTAPPIAPSRPASSGIDTTRLPATVRVGRKLRLTVTGIPDGATVRVRWRRAGVRPVRKRAVVAHGRIRVVAPRRPGTYRLQLRYRGVLVAARTVKVRARAA